MNWIQKKLIPEWKSVWKKGSVIVSGVGVAGAGAWIAIPEDQKSAILGILHINPAWMALVGFVAVIVARMTTVSQPPPPPPNDLPEEN